MNIFSKWLIIVSAKRKAAKFEKAVSLIESQGMTVCEIAKKAGTDYIRANDGSWRRIGGKRDNGAR
jgi:hypothetical protein